MSIEGQLLVAENLEALKELRKKALDEVTTLLYEADQYVVISQKGEGIHISLSWSREDIPNMLEALLETIGNMQEAVALDRMKASGNGPEFNG